MPSFSSTILQQKLSFSVGFKPESLEGEREDRLNTAMGHLVNIFLLNHYFHNSCTSMLLGSNVKNNLRE